MGSFSRVSLADAIPLCIVIVLGIILLFLMRWQVNILSMGEESAESVGVRPRRARIVVLTATALIAAGSVALCGVIGWVGLVIPHICRFFCGPDNRLLIPICAVAGGAYLLAMDILIRTVLPGEMPIGILTALIGAPLFALLLRNGRNGLEGKT
jgi:iron complex transport system permease protein